MKKFIIVALAGISLFIQSCGGDSGPGRNFGFNRGQQATSVETYTVEQSDISRQIRSYGNIRAQDVVSVTPQISNRITEIHVDLGDTVRQGEVLAEIYDIPYRDQLEQAQAQYRQNKATFERDSTQFIRQKRLHDQGLISSTEFENAQAAYENSRAAVEAARASITQSRENLKNTEIRSPVYGVVLTRNVAVGDLASTGQAAYEIANLTGYETRVYLPMEEWSQVEVGQEVSFRVSNQSAASARGRVSRISPRLDPTTGLGEVVISLTEDGPSIHQGVLVEAVINVETHRGAVVIPRSALVENVQTLIEPESNTIQLERTYSAFVVQGDTTAVKRDLELGIEQGDRVEVLAGLNPGDQVVITGQAGLEDGARVRVARGERFRQPEQIPIENTNVSEEQRQQMRERFKNMDDSSRQALRERMQKRREAAGRSDTSASGRSNQSN